MDDPFSEFFQSFLQVFLFLHRGAEKRLKLMLAHFPVMHNISSRPVQFYQMKG